MSPSPLRSRGTWKIHKRASEPDRWLDEMGFFRKHTARDSSCLFRAVSENIFNTQRYYHKVRLDCLQFMATERHLFEGSLTCSFDNYLKEMANPSEWGGLTEVSAMSHLYRRDFVIFEANKGPQTKICNGYGDTIYLFYSPDTKHFDAVYTKEFINISSFCQSLVYEILYDGVYQLKDLPYAVDKMLHDKVPTNHIEYFMSENVERRKKQKDSAKIFVEATNENNKEKTPHALALKCKHHTEDVERASLLKESLSIFVFNRSLIQLENVCLNCLNVNSARDLLDHGITPFPYKVAKALDPDIYRNIEFDVWTEIRRELRYGARYSDGTTLQVGVKCLCRLQPDQTVPYHCHIQEMRPEGGPCLVFIEELGEKHLINYEQLEPLPIEEIRPWAPPYRYSRANSQFLTLSQMLQQIGNITRKQGTGKARKGKVVEDQTTSKDNTAVAKNTQNPDDITSIDGNYVQYNMDTYVAQNNVNFPTYQHMDLFNFEPMPVECDALPLMVDCRPPAAHELPHNGSNEHHHNQITRIQPPPPEMPPGVSPPVRASTPAANNLINAVNTYPVYGGGPAPGCGYGCGGKTLVWCAPPPPPPPVNPHVYKSMQANGADLPMNDIPTLRYYFNLGVDCMWAAYGPPPQRAFHRDLAQEMQQMSLSERAGAEHKPKPPHDKAHHKGGQRPLLGPRFKRGGNNQDNNQNSNHNQNKGHNNMGNKGANNRDVPPPAPRPPARREEVCEGVVGVGVGVPYVPYPPPLYPLPYYPIEHDPGMMTMMGGMGYVNYEEGVEYGALPFAPPYPPPPHLAHHDPHK